MEWVQVIQTNQPLSGTATTYLDKAANTSKPFYSFTQENKTPGLPATQLNFYDFSKRLETSVNTVNTVNPVTWNASLYPVVANSAQKIGRAHV